MKRRIFAWGILIGFVLLLLNLIVFRFYWQLSMVVYLVIVFAFLLTNGKLVNAQGKDEGNGFQGSEGNGFQGIEDNDTTSDDDISMDDNKKNGNINDKQ